MNPRIEALLAVDARDLTEAERAELDAALAADDDALDTALAVAADAALVEEIGDPLAAGGGRPAAVVDGGRRAVAADGGRKWFAVAAAVMLLVAAVAILVVLRSSSESKPRTVEAPSKPAPVVDERVAPAPPRVATDELRALPSGAARPKPVRPGAANKKTAKLHAARGLKLGKAGDHDSAAFEYVDAFRALPSEPALAYTAAAQMERAGRCADALAWFRFAVTLEPGANFAADATRRADALAEQCNADGAVIAVTGPDADEARARVELAGDRYAEGKYRTAARMFGGAYLGYPVPELAYNVAAAYHRSDDCANTVAWFRHYLAVAGDEATDRARVEDMIAVYDKVGCDEAVSHPPPRRAAPAPVKQDYTAPKDVEFPGDATVTPAGALADEASDHAKKGNYSRAFRACEDALDLDPNSSKARMVCVISSCKLKNTKRARKHYARLSERSKRAVQQMCAISGITLDDAADEPAVDESLPERLGRTDLTAVMGRARGRIAACGDETGFTGMLTVKMRIDPDGRVSSAEASESGAIGTCVEGVIGGLQFPHAQQAIRVSYPFVFR